ncbi:MAG TPA: CPBP family intramembrane glutamic endopeptidase [Hyphomicrobiaceae bacterium]|nr:CPBP family intramembrane glutamic endopeptidase [Hyphomicrobiaceae bacterium]
MTAIDTVGALAAAGSLPRAAAYANPGTARRLRLLIELLVIFLGTPLVMAYAIHALRFPLFLVLPPVLGALIIYLLWDPAFSVTRELSRGFPLSELASIVAIFFIVGGAIAAFVEQQLPHLFLAMPRYRTPLWLTIITFYPLLSVLAQEMVYRTFYFHRYGPLFGGRRWLAITVNAALFGFGHILFMNWVAVIGTFAIGLLLAYRYERTRSYWAVCLEHTLYGWLVFTVGLGSYFFTGVSNPIWRLFW